MLWLYLVVFVWVFVAASLCVHRHAHYKRHPWEWSRRHEGLVSFTDRQTIGVFCIWPLVLIGLIGLLVVNLLVIGWDIFCEHLERKARNE